MKTLTAIKNLLKKSKNSISSIHNEEVNKIHCGGLNSEEFLEKHKGVEMENITTKPFKNVWFEVVDKLRYSKPKQRVQLFNYIGNECKEIYGEENGNILLHILCDFFEGEFYKVNNGNFENIGYIINVSSEKKWVKTVNKINSLMKSEFELQLG